MRCLPGCCEVSSFLYSCLLYDTSIFAWHYSLILCSTVVASSDTAQNCEPTCGLHRKSSWSKVGIVAVLLQLPDTSLGLQSKSSSPYTTRTCTVNVSVPW